MATPKGGWNKVDVSKMKECFSVMDMAIASHARNAITEDQKNQVLDVVRMELGELIMPALQPPEPETPPAAPAAPAAPPPAEQPEAPAENKE